MAILLSNWRVSLKTNSYVPPRYNMIDLTMTGLKSHLSNWCYLSLCSLSDHPYIYFQCDLSSPPKKRSTVRKVPRLAEINESCFLELLKVIVPPDCDLGPMSNNEAIDNEIDKITKALSSCAFRARLPINRPSGKSQPWWSKELWGLRHRLWQANKRAAVSRDCGAVEETRKLKREYQQAIRRAKRQFEMDFCSNISSSDLYT